MSTPTAPVPAILLQALLGTENLLVGYENLLVAHERDLRLRALRSEAENPLSLLYALVGGDGARALSSLLEDGDPCKAQGARDAVAKALKKCGVEPPPWNEADLAYLGHPDRLLVRFMWEHRPRAEEQVVIDEVWCGTDPGPHALKSAVKRVNKWLNNYGRTISRKGGIVDIS
jgi:hypothetical protein